MEKIKVIVPKGIRYLKEWKEFSIPNETSILNKQITGCGFTEYCLTNDEDIILCSPRKILLENKQEQHPEVFYIRNNYEKDTGVDGNLNDDKPNLEDNDNTTDGVDTYKLEEDTDFDNLPDTIRDMYKSIRDAYNICQKENRPCKIIVTYDSFRHVKWVLLKKLHVMSKFRIVVDEFQSIFTDSKFKSTTEIEFLNHLKNIKKVCYVSATPMIDKYLEELDEFKYLPYYELDWETEQPGRVIIPSLNVKQYTKSLISIVSNIINSYKEGNYDSAIVEIKGVKTKVYSKEAVFYVNSVKNICSIITKNNLTLENTNVLCAKTDKNEKALRKAFKVGKKINVFGEVPVRGETHKMFTLCTRTVYLGADFYSTNAKSYIFSDANIDSLSVDITIDLPQILGRQRLVENPWKNQADLYCKLLVKDKQKTLEEFMAYLEDKQRKTEDLLDIYSTADISKRHTLAERYQEFAKSYNYKNDYVAVDVHAGSDLKPVFNKLVMLAELRSFEIQQVDYKDRFRLFNSLKETKISYDNEVANIIENIDNLDKFWEKMRYIYNLNMSEDLAKRLFSTMSDTSFAKYYYSISKEFASKCRYSKKQLEAEFNRLNSISSTINLESLPTEIYNNFTEGNRYFRSNIKSKLQEIYDSLGYSKKAKANDIENYFEVKECTILNSETGKYDRGYNLIKKLK